MTPAKALLAGSSLAAAVTLHCGRDGGCSAGSSPDDYAPPQPTFEPTQVPDELPVQWALLRQADVFVYVEDSLFVEGGWQPQTIWSSYLVTWVERDDGDITQIEQACELVPGPVYIQTVFGTRIMETVIPDAVYANMPLAEWHARVTFPPDGEEGSSPVYQLFQSDYGPQYWVLGARLDDPVSESCPLSADDPAEWDQDQDNHPGVTVEQWIDGELDTLCYICSRTLYTFEPGTVFFDEGAHQITGSMVDVLIDQTRYGSDSEDFSGDDPMTEWNPEGRSWYWLIGLDGDATCDDVKAVFDLPDMPVP